MGKPWGMLVLVVALGGCSSQRTLDSADPAASPASPADATPPPPPPPPPAVDADAPATGGVCADLVTQYRAAVELGRRCDPRSSAPQCAQAVIDSLDCACPIFIEDTSAPTQARLAWDHVPCPLPSGWVACHVTCPARVPAQCLPVADGTGRCTETRQ